VGDRGNFCAVPPALYPLWFTQFHPRLPNLTQEISRGSQPRSKPHLAAFNPGNVWQFRRFWQFSSPHPGKNDLLKTKAEPQFDRTVNDRSNPLSAAVFGFVLADC